LQRIYLIHFYNIQYNYIFPHIKFLINVLMWNLFIFSHKFLKLVCNPTKKPF